MSKRVGVVVNPERTDLADQFVSLLGGFDCTVTTITPTDPSELGEAIDELLASGVDVVAAVGGDGTQRTAASRLANSDVPLAVVPGGTVNLLAQVIGVDDLELAAAAAAGQHHRTFDLGRLDDDLFILNASTGWDAAVIDDVGDTAKRFGRLGFAFTGIVDWLRSSAIPVRIEFDDECWYDGPAVTVLVMNVGQRASASIHIAPDAETDDGRLDVVVLRRHSLVGLLRAGMAVLRGRPAPGREVATGQASVITVAWDRAVPAQRDGDERPSAATTSYTVLPGALRVAVPDEHG